MLYKIIKFKSSLLSNFLSLVILQGANYLFPLLTIPYLFRVLGLETFGLLSFATAFVQYFVILTDFGFNLSGVQFVSENRDKKNQLDEFFTYVIASKSLLSLISFIIMLFIMLLSDKLYQNIGFFLLSFLTVFGSAISPSWFYQGLEQMKYITQINIVTRTLSIVPIFLFVKSDADYLLVPFFYGIGAVVSGLIALYVALNRFDVRLNFRNVTIIGIKKCLQDSSGFFISRISLSIYTISNTFVIGLVLGNSAAGIYTAAEKLYLAIQSFYGPLTSALYPYMVKNKNIVIFKKIFFLIVVINLAILPICILHADYIMNLVFKKIAIESICTFRILLAACLVAVPSILLGYPFLGAFGFTKFANLTVIYSSLFHLVSLSLLILFDGVSIYSVACLVILTELCVLSFRILGAKKYIL